MDRLNNGTYSRTQGTPSNRALDAGRASTESQRLRPQKKSSYHGLRDTNRPVNSINVTSRANRPNEEGNKARKSSLRDAVRKIFGRRSKEIEQPLQQRSPPRHEYHRSEPPVLPPQQEEPEPEPYMSSSPEDTLPHRTLSAPLQVASPPSLSRVRSPYAVEFPQSARLKPLNLGNPFSAPGSQLRRRKTLPSILVPDSDAAKLSASVASAQAPPVPSLEISRYTPTPEAAQRASLTRREKRRSRSADNLKRALNTERSPPRKRSDEIRYWRESSYGSVLRVSGFTSKEPRSCGTEEQDVKAASPGAADPFTDTRASRSGTLHSSPPLRHGPRMSDADIRSASGYGTELSRELEDRVAKLEAGLQHFQRSLQRMTAERNRKTVVMGGGFRQRSSTDVRTPSLLAETLSGPLGVSSYDDYGFSETRRPSTSPQPPQTPVQTPPPAIPPMPAPRRSAEALRTPSPTPIAPTFHPSQRSGNNGGSGNNGSSGNNRSSGNNNSQNYAFRSLYEMLTDERSARRKLETDMRGLRQEMVDLQYQVSVQSNVHSQRSSYIPARDPMVGSSRLRELLRETESSPPGSSAGDKAQRNSAATGFSSIGQPQAERVVSRFSGSESEVGGVAADEPESLATPYEAYQTPREERSRFPFGVDVDGEMF